MGKGNWSKETKENYSERRKIEVAAGIRIPPIGNAGNKDFRHSEEQTTYARECCQSSCPVLKRNVVVIIRLRGWLR